VGGQPESGRSFDLCGRGDSYLRIPAAARYLTHSAVSQQIKVPEGQTEVGHRDIRLLAPGTVATSML
jgi:hypothetical protein